MKQYKCRAGETLESASIANYGSKDFQSLISSANINLVIPLAAGVVLNIPDKPGVLSPADELTGVTENQVTIAIDGKIFKYWSDMTLTKSISAVSTFDFQSVFDPNNAEMRETFRPMKYKPVSIYLGKKKILTGTLVDILPSLDDTSIISASGYSKPGVLGDCCSPYSLYPLEFNAMKLDSIARFVCKPFGIDVVFLAPVGEPLDPVLMNDYDRIDPKEDEIILGYLASLAKQRNQVIADNAAGALVFQQATKKGNPVAKLYEGQSPLLSVRPSLTPQQFFSHITGLAEVDILEQGEALTVVNQKIPAGVLRPYTFSANQAGDITLAAAVKYKTSLMFGSCISYDISVDTWRDQNGNEWAPNTTLILKAPSAMIYREYEFLIADVVFKNTSKGEQIADIKIVLPESFSDTTPKVLPWDE